jgi:dipeptidyl-peptidase-3
VGICLLPALLLMGALAVALPNRLQAAAPAGHNSGDDASAPSSLVTRVRDTGFLQINADAFNDLSPSQKMDAYWLSMAAIAVNPIAYGQNSVYGLQEKRLLEAILTHPRGIAPDVLKEITEYTMLFGGNQGNHNDFNSRKFVPDFTPTELTAAAEQARKNGATELGSADALQKELSDLEKPIFDANFQSMLTVKNPVNGQDPLEASAVNY